MNALRPRPLTFIATLICGVAVLPAVGPALAQQGSGELMAPENGGDQPQVDTSQTPDFHAFWQRFQAAAKKNNRKALQSMTHLPFDLNTTSYDAARFKELAAQIYDTKARDCIAKETPVHDQDNYEVFCGETVYVFGTDPTLTSAAPAAGDGSAWRLLEIGAND